MRLRTKVVGRALLNIQTVVGGYGGKIYGSLDYEVYAEFSIRSGRKLVFNAERGALKYDVAAVIVLEGINVTVPYRGTIFTDPSEEQVILEW